MKNPLLSYPNRITIELSNKCNLTCQSCPRNHMTGQQGLMPFSLFKKICAELSSCESEITVVPFFRGEPLLHPEFKDIITHLRNTVKAKIQLATNAVLLNQNMSNFILDMGIDFISFSLDAIDKNLYERVRKGAKFEKVIENINNFLTLRNLRKLKKPETQISAIETQATKVNIADFVKFWKGKVDRIRIYKEHSDKGIYGKLKNGITNMSIKRKLCYKPFTEITIYWDGKVALCNYDWDRKEELGDITKNSLKEIWDSKLYSEVRQYHLDQHFPESSVCKNCDQWMSYYLPENSIGEVYYKN